METVDLDMVLKKLILSIPFCRGINYFVINTILLYSLKMNFTIVGVVLIFLTIYEIVLSDN